MTACCTTAALSNGVDYLLLYAASANSDENDSTTEVEVTFGGTRYGFARNRVDFNTAPDSATGAQLAGAVVVTGNGSNTAAINFRRLDGPGNTDHFCSGHLFAIPLDSLTENTHWYRSEGTNTDSVSTPGAGSGWATSGQSIDITPGSTGDWLIIAAMEGEHNTSATSSDQIRMRCRFIVDPTGSPTNYNLQQNQSGSSTGAAEVQIRETSSCDMAYSCRWLDVVSLTGSTTYRFRPEWEGVTSGGNTGYRRARVYAFDLSNWPEFAYSRTLNSQQGTAPNTATFGNASASAPSGARDYVLLASTSYQNNTTWMRAVFDTDPTGTPTELPTSNGFGQAVHDLGVASTDDYCIVSPQWSRASISSSQTIGLRVDIDNADSPVGHRLGTSPGDSDDDIYTTIVVWGMETSVSANITGTIATSLPTPTASASGNLTHPGTIATNLPLPDMTAAGDLDHPGTIATSLPMPTASASGDLDHPGTIATSLPVITASAAGDVTQVYGTIATSLPLPTASASGDLDHPGTVATSLPLPTASASGDSAHTGTMASSLPVLTASATGDVAHTGTIATSLPIVTMSASGTVTTSGSVTGTIATSLPILTASASGDLDHPGTIASSLPIPVASASGDMDHPGTIATSLPVPVGAASGDVAHTGTIATSLPLITQSASGTVTAGGSVTGTIAAVLPLLTAAMAGSLDHPGTIAASLPIPAQSASGALDHPGSMSATLPLPTGAASGTSSHDGSAAGTLPAPTMAASGQIGGTIGTVVASLPMLSLWSIGRAIHRGAGGLPGDRTYAISDYIAELHRRRRDG